METSIRSGWRHGWIDYDRRWLNRWQITLPEADAQRLSSEVTVALSLVIPCFYIVVRRFVLAVLPVIYSAIRAGSVIAKTSLRCLMCQLAGRRLQQSTVTIALHASERQTGESTFLETLESVGDEDNPFKTIRKLFTDLRNVRETESSISAELQKVLKEDTLSAYKRLRANPQLAVAIFSAAAMVLGLCVLGIWAGIESANILTDSFAISDYEPNGHWYFNLRWIQSNIPSPAELAAANYKDDCYWNVATRRASGNKVACRQFSHTSIPHMWTSNASCPFGGDICLQGSTAAFKLSTGWADTNVLGINASKSSRMRFQKTMTCNPVSNDEPWVSYNETERNWRYFYHQCNDTIPTEPTFTNPGDWSRYVGPLVGYSAKAIRLSPPFSGWYRVLPCNSPRVEFRAGSGLVSLVFVVPLGEMMFTNYRDDPIFPAKDDADPPYDRIAYQSKTTKAGILGCVDSFQVCNSANTRCWDQGNWTEALEMVKACHGPSSEGDPQCSDWSSHNPSPEERLILFLLDIALEDADAAGSILRRGGRGLEATKLIGANRPFTFLEGEQWKVEAENLFQISLARMQLNIFDFARETHVDGGHAISDRVPDYAMNAYKLYKFPATGYKNIDGAWFVGTNISASFFSFGVVVTRHRSNAEMISEREAMGDTMVTSGAPLRSRSAEI